MLSGSQILKIKKPERLFTGTTEDEVRGEFHRLARRYHPDHYPEAGEVFTAVNGLYQQAVKRFAAGTWGEAGGLKIELPDGKYKTIEYLTDRPFELGHVYIGTLHITYTIKPEFHDLFVKAANVKFTYADKNMQNQFETYLPQRFFPNADSAFKLKNGDLCMVYQKDPELLSLRDVLNHYKGRIPGRHAAWIIGTLGNLVCYLSFQKISHQDISLDTYFIHPRLHTGALLGGWWYATKFNHRVKHVPVRTLNLLPFAVRRTKKASHLTDLELIRGVGREILGDDDLKVPKSIEKWLNSVATKSAIEDYSSWLYARDTSGPRQFVKMSLTSENLYG